MTDVGQILLQDAADGLRRRVMLARDLSTSGRAHLTWVLRDDTLPGNLADLAIAAAANLNASRSYHDVAVLGYAAHALGLEGSRRDALSEGVNWLLGRSPEIAGEPAPFYADGVALLGVALGARLLGDKAREGARDWMLTFIPYAAALPAVEAWQQVLLATALNIVGSGNVSVTATPDAADVRTALRARSALVDSANREAVEADEQLALSLLRQQRADDLSAIRAGLRLAAYAWIRRSAPVVVSGRATSNDVVALLEHVTAGLRRWTWEASPRTGKGQPRKWHIEHEYHVQNLLYALLAPIFPDLKDEEYFPSLGQKQPRTDLYIPSLKLIVEVKFLRAKDKVSKAIDEVAADVGLYLTPQSDYSSIVAFVWDDSRRVEEHRLLKDGLTKMTGVVGAVVVSRPGSMSD
jgi:hypothetical protein